jgi:hypothetical protein
MERETKLQYYFEENLENPFKEDIMVNVTIRDVPSKLLKEFMEKVVNARYPSGLSTAIKDMMWIAVQKSKGKQVPLQT